MLFENLSLGRFAILSITVSHRRKIIRIKNFDLINSKLALKTTYNKTTKTIEIFLYKFLIVLNNFFLVNIF